MKREQLLKMAEGLISTLDSIDDGSNDPSFYELYHLAQEAKSYYSGYFPITAIHRDDLISQGFKDANPTNQEMEILAEKLCDHFTEYGGYWDVIDIYCEEVLNLTKTEEEESE